MQAAETSFCRVVGLSLRRRVRSLEWSLSSSAWKSQLRSFGHLRMPPRCLPLEVLLAHPARERLQGSLWAHWRDYISHPAWESLRGRTGICCWEAQHLEYAAARQSYPTSDKRMSRQMQMHVLHRFPPFEKEKSSCSISVMCNYIAEHPPHNI